MYKTLFQVSVLSTLVLGACDLQPKIASIPDSVGMFIEDRYPALLADPNTQPEIYNSAASDYGLYASPELYGTYSNTNDYILYASVDDYVLTPEKKEIVLSEHKAEDDYLLIPGYKGADSKQNANEEIIVARGDTLYSLARKNNTSVIELANINGLHEPYTLSVGQKLKKQKSENIVQKKVNTVSQKSEIVKPAEKSRVVTKRIDLQEVIVEKGDTLYSLSRKYEIPVNDLAVMNKISAPFALSVGQKIKVPKIDKLQTTTVPEKVVSKTDKNITPAKQQAKASNNTAQKQTVAKNAKSGTREKISSDPKKQLPKISARSSAKFSWPVRGKILSAYGAKSSSLFNDGINISASLGTTVKAAENGVVAYAGNEVKGMGNLIIMQHSDGWMTIYAHLDSMSVKRGTKVNVGSPIGRVGKTGKVDVPQLHFEIRKGKKAYNPTQYLKK